MGRGIETGEFSVRCFPVPFDHTLTIQIETQKAENVQVQIFDVIGRQVAMLFNGISEGSLSLPWNTLELPNGNYFVRVSTAEKTLTQTVVRAN
jgi:hypothetical protein